MWGHATWFARLSRAASAWQLNLGGLGWQVCLGYVWHRLQVKVCLPLPSRQSGSSGISLPLGLQEIPVVLQDLQPKQPLSKQRLLSRQGSCKVSELLLLMAS